MREKFKATLSPINIFLILPSIKAITEPLLTFDPSFFFYVKFNIFYLIKLKVCLANSSPPIIPFLITNQLNF